MPTFANSARATLAYVAESAYGTTPETPTMKKLRHTGGDGPQHSKSALISEERRSDRQRPIGRHGMNRVGGTISSEGLAFAHQDWIAAALGQSLTTFRGFTSIADASSNNLTWATSDDSLSRASGSFVTDGWRVGMKLRYTGAGTNAGVWTVLTVAALKLTFEENVADQTLSTGAHVHEGYLFENGTTETSFSVERAYADIVQYEVYTGVEVDSWEVRAEVDAFLQWSFGIIGAGFSDGTSPLDASPDDVDTGKALVTFSGTIEEGGSAAAIIKSIGMTAANNRRPAEVLGSSTIVDTTPGRFTVSGSASALFQNAALRDKFSDETESSLEFSFKNPAGDEVFFLLPEVLYMGANKSHGGDDDVMLEMPFESFYDTTTGITLRVNCVPAVAAA